MESNSEYDELSSKQAYKFDELVSDLNNAHYHLHLFSEFNEASLCQLDIVYGAAYYDYF